MLSGTIYGATWTTDARFGNYALSFDGNDYVVMTGFKPTVSSGFSVSAWFKTSTSGTRMFIANQWGAGGAGNASWGIEQTSEDYLWIETYDGTTSYPLSLGTYNDGEWHHIVLVFDGTYLIGYIDGNEVDRRTASIQDSTAYDVYIGAEAVYQSNGWIGVIDDVRMFNRALSSDEVQALFNGEDVGGGRLLCLRMDEGEGSTVYSDNWCDGKYGEAFSLDGVDDYGRIEDSDSLKGFIQMTVLMWVKIRSGIGYWGFISKTDRTNGWQLIKQYGSRRLFFEIFEAGSNTGSSTSSNSEIPEDTWTQIGIIVDGLNWKFIINGEVDKEFTSSRALTHSSHTLWIGRSNASSPYLSGIIDEVRLYNRALSEEEIRALYLAGKTRYSRSIVVSDKFRIFNSSLTEVLRVTSAGQLQLPTQGSSGGILIGGDANLYRGGTDLLKTDDDLEIYKRLFINQDPFSLYIAGTEKLRFWTSGAYFYTDVLGNPTDTNSLGSSSYAWKNLYIGTGKIYFGTTQDVNLYRSTTNVLKTDDDFYSQTLHTLAGTTGGGQWHLALKTSNALRFAIGLIGNEGGGNSGSDFFIWRYDDSGGSLGEALRIVRSSGQVRIRGGLVVENDYIYIGSDESIRGWLRIYGGSGSAGGHLALYGGAGCDDYNIYVSGNDLIFYNKTDSRTNLMIDGDGIVYSRHLRPLSNNTYDFGSSSYRWKDGYFAGYLDIRSTNEIPEAVYIQSQFTGTIDVPNLYGFHGRTYGSEDLNITGNFIGFYYDHYPWAPSGGTPTVGGDVIGADFRTNFLFTNWSIGGDIIGLRVNVYPPSSVGGSSLIQQWLWDGTEKAKLDKDGNLQIDGAGDLGSLRISGTPVITSGLVLQNIASIAQDLLPDADGTRDLGSSSLRWAEIHASSKIVVGQINLERSNEINNYDGLLYLQYRTGNYVQIGGDTESRLRVMGRIDPVTNNAYNLGTDTLRWKSLYLSDHLYLANDKAVMGKDTGGTNISLLLIDSTDNWAAFTSPDGTGLYLHPYLGQAVNIVALDPADGTYTLNLLAISAPSTRTDGELGSLTLNNSVLNMMDHDISRVNSIMGRDDSDLFIKGNSTATAGTARAIQFQYLDPATDTWKTGFMMSNAGHLLPGSPNTYNLGGAGSEFANLYIGTGSIYLGDGQDVRLYRGASNTLYLASGDSLNLVSGSIKIGGTTVISSSGMLSLDSQHKITKTKVLSLAGGSDVTLSSNWQTLRSGTCSAYSNPIELSIAKVWLHRVSGNNDIQVRIRVGSSIYGYKYLWVSLGYTEWALIFVIPSNVSGQTVYVEARSDGTPTVYASLEVYGYHYS